MFLSTAGHKIPTAQENAAACTSVFWLSLLLTASLLLTGCTMTCDGCKYHDLKEVEPDEAIYNGEKKLTTEQMTADLDYLIDVIISTHPDPYAYISKQQFEANKKDAYDKVRQPLRLDDFFLIAAKLTSSIRNGHTRLHQPKSWNLRLNDSKSFPIILKVKNDRVYFKDIVKNNPDLQTLEVVSIEGKPALKLTKQFASYFPREGNEGNYAFLYIPVTTAYLLALEFEGKDKITLELKNTAGEITEYDIPATTIKLKDDVFNTPAAPDTTDKALQKTHKNLMRFELLKKDIGLITINSFDCPKYFKKNCESVFDQIKSAKIKNLIIDLRNCPGGMANSVEIFFNYVYNRPWDIFNVYRKVSSLSIHQKKIKYIFWPHKIGSTIEDFILPQLPTPFKSNRFRGNIYLLTNLNSYSASTCLAAAMKHYKIATLIGEETGDTASFYADNIDYTLPNSGLKGIVASAYHKTPLMENTVGRGVMPHYEVEDQRKLDGSNDAILEFTLDMIRNR